MSELREHDVCITAHGVEMEVDDPDAEQLSPLLDRLRESTLLGIVVGYVRGRGPDMVATVVGVERREDAERMAASIFGDALVELGLARRWQPADLDPGCALLTAETLESRLGPPE